MTARHAGYMQTFTGRYFYPLAPDAGNVDVRDIAHGLAMVCRFGGHTRFHYSVAQHSVIVSRIVPRELALWGLLHDASEAYLGDTIQPLKTQDAWGTFREIEGALQRCIIEQWAGLPWPEPHEVKAADRKALVTERRDVLGAPLVPYDPATWEASGAPLPTPMTERIEPWSPDRASVEFLWRFHELTR